MRKGILFGSAVIEDYHFCRRYMEADAVIICCDGGMKHTRKMGIRPDYILGDFDSVDTETLDFYKEMGIEMKEFPSRKNQTDLELGLNFAIDLGCGEVVIFGALGSRLDHTLANLHLLKYALDKGVTALLADEKNCIRLIKSHTVLKGKKGDIVSAVPMSEMVYGITNRGLEYPLHDFDMPLGSTRGVSNVMEGEEAEISLREGYLFVIQSKD